MRFLLAYTFFVSILLSVAAVPTPHHAVVKITDVKAQVAKHGQTLVDNVNEAALQSQINVEQAIRVVDNSQDPKNVNILREAFGDEFRLHLREIRRSLVNIQKGVLKIDDVNTLTLGPEVKAYWGYSTRRAYFGPLFHQADDKAGIMLHERSHAFADTGDYFSKKDGRVLFKDELGEAHWTGYLWSADWPHIPSACKARNADSFMKLGDLARHQLDVLHATPSPKKNPIIMIINEHDQIKKYGKAAINKVKEAAQQSQKNVEWAIGIIDRANVKENKKILEDVFGSDVQLHLPRIREWLQKIKTGVLLVGDVHSNRIGYTQAKYNFALGESTFSQHFHTTPDSRSRAWTMLSQRAYGVGAFKYFSKHDGRGLTALEVSKTPFNDYYTATQDANKDHGLYTSTIRLPSASKANNAGSIAELGRRAQMLAEQRIS